MNTILVMLSPLIPILPFLAVPLILLFRKQTNGGAVFSIGANFISWIIATALLITGIFEYAAHVIEHGHIEGLHVEQQIVYTFLENPKIEFGILLDPLSVIMAAVVSTLALLIQIYSIGYMKDEPGKHSGRYFAEITIFVGAMLGLALSLNFLFLFIFWEIMGLCSYLLIGFFMDKETEKPGTGPASAAKKAFLITKVGDILLFGGIVLLMLELISAGVTEPLNIISGMTAVAGDTTTHTPGIFENRRELQTLIAVLIFGGAVGKSAQFPLHIWLPDAMEGPTTVSALIHSATMVKAGVFLLARCYWIFEGTDALLFVALIGGFTAFFAATMAFVATDIKKILAYSTISQLAYMILGIGVGGVASGVFHMLSHSFFKCLLFLGAGSIIHSYHTQEITEIRGLRKHMPKTGWTFLIGGLGLSGIIPFNGFFSKDAIFASAWLQYENSGNSLYLVLFLLAVITAGMTGFYIFRAIFMMMSKEKASSGHGDSHHHPHESPSVITIPLIILGSVVILMGLASLVGLVDILLDKLGMGMPLAFINQFNPVSEHTLVTWLGGLLIHPSHETVELAIMAILMVLSLVVAGTGILMAYLIYSNEPEGEPSFIGKIKLSTRSIKTKIVTSSFGVSIDYILVNRYGIDALYRNIGIGINKIIGELLYRVDKLVLDELVIHNVARGTIKLAGLNDAVDRKIIDGTIDNTGRGFLRLGELFSRMQSGITQNYAVGMFLGLLLFMIIWFIGFFYGGF
ncbi:MAG: NADH-quinone oxidoreductase subunit 5 family protein [Candidatus Hodarchaeales archaeon]|jgi:NADH-quinone oxidoreductase subunit L